MSRAVALDDLARAMAGRDATMPAEVALAIVLMAVEAMIDDALVLDPAGVEVDGRGVVRLTDVCALADDARAPQVGVMTLLETMRVAPSSRVAALLSRLRSQTTYTLAALQAELAAQVPADRASAQRAVGATVREFFRPAREEVEAEEARAAAAAAPVARREDDVVQALIAEAKAAEAEAAVMPGRQATVSIVGADPAPLRPPPAPKRGASAGIVVAVVAVVAVVVMAVMAVAASRLRG